MNLIDRIILEWSYRTKKGYPDINNQEDLRVFESTFGFNLKEGKKERDAVQAIISANPGKFETMSNDSRIANKTEISEKEFIKAIQNTFGEETDVVVTPPGNYPNPSKKFNLFTFEAEGKEISLILAGGASANLGQKFENMIAEGLINSIGSSIEDIEDPRIAKIFTHLGINPETLEPGSIEQTGGKDTLRPLNLEKGPQDRGYTIADVSITSQGNPYYISIKNKTGDNIYNGGNVSAIRYNQDKTEIIFDPETYYRDTLKVKIFEIFKLDPKKVTTGLNEYIKQEGVGSSWIQVDLDTQDILKFIGSAVDYGYYYLREDKADIKILDILSPEDTYKFIGTPGVAQIKYPSSSSKTTYARVQLLNSNAGLKHVEVQIRNAQGGVDRPSIKVQVK